MRKGRYYYTAGSKYTEKIGKPLEVFSIVSYEETQEALIEKIIHKSWQSPAERNIIAGAISSIGSDLKITVKIRPGRSWEIKTVVAEITYDVDGISKLIINPAKEKV